MDLFNTEKITNLLPCDGVVNYYGKVLKQKEAAHYLDRLLNTIEWKNDEAVIFGKHITTKRKAAWYDDDDYLYTYSNTTKQALSWTKELSDLKQIVEELAGATFNSCLLNLYHNGDEGMAWPAMMKDRWVRILPLLHSVLEQNENSLLGTKRQNKQSPLYWKMAVC